MMTGHGMHNFDLTHGLYVSMLLAGLVGGFLHCTMMCSPFVLAQVESDRGHNMGRLRSSLLLPYHLGRMTTYVGLAMLFSSVINMTFMSMGLRPFVVAPMLMLAGVLFVVSAFPQMVRVFPWVGNLHLYVPYKLFSRFSEFLMEKKGVLGRYGLGVVLGFLPCGMVMSAIMASGTAPSALEAGIAMGLFALGTVPSLVMVALGGQVLKNKFPKFSKRFSQIAMVVSGLWLFFMAGRIIL